MSPRGYALGLAVMACSLARQTQSASAPDAEPARVLWTEAFTNDGPPFGWAFTALRPTREALGLRVNLTGESGRTATLSRRIPIRLDDVRDEVVYSQFFIAEVGGDRMTMWHPPGAGAGYNPGHHPGLWTVPYKMRRAAATNEYYRVDFYGTGYVTLKFIRLVTGETPLSGSAHWLRDGPTDWARPALRGERLRVVANLGPLARPPTVSFVVSSFNCYRPADVTGAGLLASLPLNDGGRDGDAAAGDGFWTAELVVAGSVKYPAGWVTAVVRFGEGECDVTYTKAPWAFDVKP